MLLIFRVEVYSQMFQHRTVGCSEINDFFHPSEGPVYRAGTAEHLAVREDSHARVTLLQLWPLTVPETANLEETLGATCQPPQR